MLLNKVKYYEFERFRLDVARREINTPEESFPLTEKTFEVLQYLLQNNGSLIRKSDFFSDIWNSDSVDETNLTQHIYRIRKILGNRDDDSEFIETIPKLGYKFAPAVVAVFDENESETHESIDDNGDANGRQIQIESFKDLDFKSALDSGITDSVDDNHSISTSQTDDKMPVDHLNPVATEPNPKFTRIISFTGITIAFVIAALITVTLLELRSAYDDPISVTVFPFRQIGELQDEKFQLGIADSLITRIGHDEKLTITPTNVIGPLSPANSSNHNEGIFEIGDKLKTDIIIIGTIQRESDTVRVNMQFFHGKDKRQICTVAFDETFANVFALQDTISIRAQKKLLEEIEKHDEFANRY